MPEHNELGHARRGTSLAEGRAYMQDARAVRGGGPWEDGGVECLRDATTARPASYASRNSSPPVSDAQTEGKHRQERRREARNDRRTSIPGIVLCDQGGREGGLSPAERKRTTERWGLCQRRPSPASRGRQSLPSPATTALTQPSARLSLAAPNHRTIIVHCSRSSHSHTQGR